MTVQESTDREVSPKEKHSDQTRAAISVARKLIQGEIDAQRRELDKARAVLEAAQITFNEHEEEFAHARASDILEVAIAMVAGANRSLDSVNLKELWHEAGL